MTKLEQAARQALEALEVYEIKLNSRLCNEAITALRSALADSAASSSEALAEQAEQEPVNVDAINTSSEYVDEIENKRHEPVAWVNKERTQSIEWLKIAPEHGTKLYAAPVRTKDLTDDEIEVIFKSHIGKQYDGFARAVIAADREKNK